MTKKITAALSVLIVVVALMGAATQLDLSTQVQGLLAKTNGGTGLSSTATFPSSGTVATTATVPNSGSCTNQVVTALNNGTTPTCASVANAMLASGSYIKGVFHAFCTGTAVVGATTNFDFAGFGSTATICSTALTSASGGMKMTSAGTIKNLFVNLSAAGKAGDNIKLLKNASATGAPTCTYGATTTCNDVSTSLAVAQGDVITISNTTSASETAANITVTFEFWN